MLFIEFLNGVDGISGHSHREQGSHNHKAANDPQCRVSTPSFIVRLISLVGLQGWTKFRHLLSIQQHPGGRFERERQAGLMLQTGLFIPIFPESKRWISFNWLKPKRLHGKVQPWGFI